MHSRLRAASVLVAALLWAVPKLSAQQVTGRVVDQSSGQPMAAVQVSITGTGIGALSQQSGRYLLLNVPAGTHTVTAQRIGYRTVTAQVTVSAGATVVHDFTLAEEALGLDEIIVTGTPGGTQRRAIGNAVTAVKASDVTKTSAVTTMQDMLVGRSPGVQFTRANGTVGTGAPIQIRGVGSFNLGSAPLIFVDGIRVNNQLAGPDMGSTRDVNPLDDFNPSDIESIEIIKGPAAATLYGTEASAGVIQIITKRGSEGTPQFDMTGRVGTSYMADPAGKIGTRWGCKDRFQPPCNEQTGGLFSYNPYDEATYAIAQGLFPWPQEHIYRNGLSQGYNLEIRGGTPVIRYYASGNYDNEQGIVFYNWDKTFRTRANLGVVFSEHLTFDMSTGFVQGKTRFAQPATGDGGEWEDMTWGNGYCQPRINPGIPDCTRLIGFQEHLPSDVAKLEMTRAYSRFTGSATLNFTGGGWFSSRLIGGLDRGWDEDTGLWPKETVLQPVYEETATGLILLEHPTNTDISLDWSATGKYKPIASIGTSTSVGVQYYTKKNVMFGLNAVGLASSLSKTVNQTPPASSTILYTHVENKSLGFFVQEELSWQDRVFVTAAIRFDDNSAFGSEFDLEKYPKVSATWVVSDENFWNVDLVNSLRLRGALGKAGRQPDAFAGTNLFGVFAGPSGIAAFRPTSPGNPEVGPETSTELELGFDLALFDDRVSGEFTWFNKKNEDALLSVGLAPSLGAAGNTQRNLGRIDNWGWEASVHASVYQNSAFSVALDLTGAHVMNEIKSLGDFQGTNNIRIGLPYPNYTKRLWLVDAEYDPAGTIQDAWGQRIAARCDSGIALGEGGTKYGRVRGGEPIDCSKVVADQLLVGPRFYPYRWSAAPSIRLLNNVLSVNMLFDGAYGRVNADANVFGHRYNNSYESRCECDPVWVAGDRLATSGPTVGKRIAGTGDSGYYDASFWKLREIGLMYNLPEFVAGRIGADRASLALSARDLWTIWVREPGLASIPIADPEMGRADDGGSPYHRALPALTSLSATLRVSF